MEVIVNWIQNLSVWFGDSWAEVSENYPLERWYVKKEINKISRSFLGLASILIKYWYLCLLFYLIISDFLTNPITKFKTFFSINFMNTILNLSLLVSISWSPFFLNHKIYLSPKNLFEKLSKDCLKFQFNQNSQF